jgi:hypothetical protein
MSPAFGGRSTKANSTEFLEQYGNTAPVRIENPYVANAPTLDLDRTNLGLRSPMSSTSCPLLILSHGLQRIRPAG